MHTLVNKTHATRTTVFLPKGVSVLTWEKQSRDTPVSSLPVSNGATLW